MRVWDVNDNAPVWVGSPYHVRLSELTAVGSRVLPALRATDADQAGPHATIHYSVMPGPNSVCIICILLAIFFEIYFCDFDKSCVFHILVVFVYFFIFIFLFDCFVIWLPCYASWINCTSDIVTLYQWWAVLERMFCIINNLFHNYSTFLMKFQLWISSNVD